MVTPHTRSDRYLLSTSCACDENVYEDKVKGLGKVLLSKRARVVLSGTVSRMKELKSSFNGSLAVFKADLPENFFMYLRVQDHGF